MQTAKKLPLALIGVAICILIARNINIKPEDLLPRSQPEVPSKNTSAQIASNLYFGQPISISLGQIFNVSAPRFTVNTSELIVVNRRELDINFTFPQDYNHSTLRSFSSFVRNRGIIQHPNLFIGFDDKLFEYRCNFSEDYDKVQCPSTPITHKIPNVLYVYYDIDANLSFVVQNDTTSGHMIIKMAVGEDINNVIDQAITKETCKKFFFAPEYTQLLCVRSSGVSLDAYNYSNVTKTLFYENFTAESLNIKSLDDFVFDTKQNYVNSGIIRVKEDLLFVRNEIRRRYKDPFGNKTEDYTIYASFPKLIAASKRLNRIIQFDYGRIENLIYEGEYDLQGCSISNETSIHLSHNMDMLYLTCSRENRSAFLYIFNPRTKTLRQAIPMHSMKKSSSRYSILNDELLNLDLVFYFDTSSLYGEKIFTVPTLIGATNDLRPIDGTTVQIIPFAIQANSSISANDSATIEGKITVVFPERPIDQLSNEIVFNASKTANDTYTVYFENHQLFRGAVHNLSFELINSSQKTNFSWNYTRIADFASNILIPNISSDEVIYDYHYLPVRSPKGQENDGIFVLLTTNEKLLRGYLTVYNVTRQGNSTNFEKVTFVDKFQIADPFCPTLTIVNIGEFSLNNLFGFVQCQMSRMAIYGYALANRTKILDETIEVSEAWINFAFDDVSGHIVVFHKSVDDTSNYIEFYQFYPLGKHYNNPVKAIPFSALELTEQEMYEPAGYDLIVNPNSQTFEIYSIALDGTLVYCSTPIQAKGKEGNEFCVKNKITNLVDTGTIVKDHAWNGLQIIKDYTYLSAIYLTDYSYSNGLKFVINSEIAAAFMFETIQPSNAEGAELADNTGFKVLKGFADYYPDYKKLTFFNVDERYVMFVGHTFNERNEFVYIIFDHTKNETNSNYFRICNGNNMSSYPILEATTGRRYRSTDVGLSPTRIFTENLSDYHRRVVTIGTDNTLIQHFMNRYNTLSIRGSCSEVTFKAKAMNDRFVAETTVRVVCPQK